MKRIYPLSPYKTATWINWGSYTYWLDNEILSLQQYLQMFNANYQILNDSVKYINSNTWIAPVESEENTTINGSVWKQLSIEGLDEDVYFCYPGDLKWRQGILNNHTKGYLCLDPAIIEEGETNTLKRKAGEEDDSDLVILQKRIRDNQLYLMPISTVVFAKKWLVGEQSKSNTQTKSLEHYQFIAKPIAALYLPLSIQNGIYFSYVENGQSVLGENINFALELVPNRYFYNGENEKWKKGGISFSTQGATWANPHADTEIKISNSVGQFWTNSFTLMHDCYIPKEYKEKNYKDLEYVEDFIFDQTFAVNNINVANHQTVEYIIDTVNIKETETNNNLWNNIQVLIL